jgi:hypothetical protein
LYLLSLVRHACIIPADVQSGSSFLCCKIKEQILKLEHLKLRDYIQLKTFFSASDSVNQTVTIGYSSCIS